MRLGFFWCVFFPGQTVTGGTRPPLIYDYGGFPAASCQLKYPAAGNPALAARVVALLRTAGHPAADVSPDRGWDHGVFVPLMLAFPDADVPIVQLSLVAGMDPEVHWAIGQALRPLRDDGVMIVGSGSSYHNMMGFFGRVPNVAAASAAFDAHITAAVTDESAAARRAKLLAWDQAPHARECHPPRAEEHLVPLFVAAGAARDDESGVRVYSEDNLMGSGVTVSAWQFGG